MYNLIAVPRLPRRSLPEPSRSRGDPWATVLSCTVTWLRFLDVSIKRQALLVTRGGSSGERAGEVGKAVMSQAEQVLVNSHRTFTNMREAVSSASCCAIRVAFRWLDSWR